MTAQPLVVGIHAMPLIGERVGGRVETSSTFPVVQQRMLHGYQAGLSVDFPAGRFWGLQVVVAAMHERSAYSILEPGECYQAGDWRIISDYMMVATYYKQQFYASRRIENPHGVEYAVSAKQ